jgi:phospholipid transport system substrate-binding protein
MIYWQVFFCFVLRLTVTRAFCAAALILATLLMVARPVGAAGDANPAASAFIRDLAAEAIKELTDPAVPQPRREALFRRLLNDHFDMAAISKFALGRYWRLASESQRIEFQHAFEDYLVHSYSARFSEYHGTGLHVAGSTNEANGVVIVHSKINTSKTEDVLLDWHLHSTDATFMIVDIVIEGVSMAVTERADFGSVIQSRGIDGLIEALRAKSSESAGTSITH